MVVSLPGIGIMCDMAKIFMIKLSLIPQIFYRSICDQLGDHLVYLVKVIGHFNNFDLDE